MTDQTARSVQSDLDLHCPQIILVSSSVRKKLIAISVLILFQLFYLQTRRAYQLSAGASNLEKTKILSFGNVLTLCHTIRLLKTLKKKPFENIVVTSIFSFYSNVFSPPQKEFLFFSHIYFVICKCFQFKPV